MRTKWVIVTAGQAHSGRRDRADDKGLELATLVQPGVPTAVRGDPGRVRQVLTNLVGNAIKFTETGEVVVRVGLSDESQQAAVIRLEVTDTGTGIALGDQERLFARFSQADASTTRRYGGTGLGLSIAKRLAELMGGQIGVESEVGRGSMFWFTVRLERGAEDDLTPPARVNGLAGLRVLIVDDNATDRAILAQNLTSWGTRPAGAQGAAEGLDILRAAAQASEPFAVALIDLQMPEMDGLAMARAITDDPALAGTRLVLLTSAGQRGDPRRAHEAGFAAFLTKPVRQSALYGCLTAVTGPGTPEPSAPLITRHSVTEAKGRALAHILVVDDNAANQKVAALMLAKMGYRVDVAANGVEALEAISRTSYAAVLMDCQMPEMDGYEATTQIRQLGGPEGRVPIIALTASAMKSDEEKCLAAGMDDYVAKPLRFEALAAVLDHWIVPDPSHTHEGGAGTAVAPPQPAQRGPDSAALDPAVIAELRTLDPGGGGRELSGLVTAFLGSAEERLEELREAVERGDLDAVARLSHGLKGSSANLGAHHMAALCAEMEAMVSVSDLSGAPACLARLEDELGRVPIALRDAFPEGPV